MNNFLSTICGFAQSNDFYSIVTFLCEKERTGEIVLYAGTYSLETALERFGSYDNASFYIYTTQDKSGYCVYINRMSCGIREDNKIFKFSHRYLYNKNHLSNCFFGEKDCRSGEYFEKKDKKQIGFALLEILGEILITLIFFGIGALIVSAFGIELDSSSINDDSIILLGIVVTVAILVIVCALVQWFKKIIGGNRK